MFPKYAAEKFMSGATWQATWSATDEPGQGGKPEAMGVGRGYKYKRQSDVDVGCQNFHHIGRKHLLRCASFSIIQARHPLRP